MLELDPRLSLRSSYLLGISGGRDSVALLHALLAAGCRKITLCHLNHQLRGLFSSDDAAFVRDLAEKHELPFEIGRMNVQRIADDDGIANQIVGQVRAKNYKALIIVRCRYRDSVAMLRKAGANRIVSEEEQAGLALQQALGTTQYAVPKHLSECELR